MGVRLEPSIDFSESLLALILVCDRSQKDFPIDLDHLHRIQFINTNFPNKIIENKEYKSHSVQLHRKKKQRRKEQASSEAKIAIK